MFTEFNKNKGNVRNFQPFSVFMEKGDMCDTCAENTYCALITALSEGIVAMECESFKVSSCKQHKSIQTEPASKVISFKSKKDKPDV